MNYKCRVCQAPITEARKNVSRYTCSREHAIAYQQDRHKGEPRQFDHSRVVHTTTCTMCGKPMPAQRISNGALTCGIECSRLRVHRPVNHLPTLVAGTIGAMHEYMVVADLLRKGYEVFRAASPSTSCDLAVLKDRQLLRVEVTTGYIRPGDKRLVHPKSSQDGVKFDILAVVTDPAIFYLPDTI